MDSAERSFHRNEGKKNMVHSLTDTIRADMLRFSMSPEDGRILAAVSGGADSVCLLLALKEIGYDVSAVHVEHGIRGKESLADCEYVRQLCSEHRVRLRVIHADAPAAAGRDRISLEEAARQERYRALKQAGREMGISCIAVAHHRMDQAETVLWNLIRGSSITGLGGIRPVRRDEDFLLVRPLIGCDREQIEEYLKARGISWRTDCTNADTKITRNAIRLKVLPLLETLNPGAIRHIASAAQDLREADRYLETRAEEIFRDVLTGDGEDRDLIVDRDLLGTYPAVLRLRVLRKIIARCCGSMKDITRRHVEALDGLCGGSCGHFVSLPGGWKAVSEAGILRLTRQKKNAAKETFSPKTKAEIALTRPGIYSARGTDAEIELDVEYITWNGDEVPKKRYTKYLAYDTMTPCLSLRTRRPGDYLVVNREGGRRKLKDYLIDEKVPRDQRDSIWLVAQGSHVLWVIGMRISEDAKVREGSKAVRIQVTFRF